MAARVPAVRRSSGRQAAQGAAGSAATLRLPRRRSNARKEMSSYSVSPYIVSYTAGPRRTTIQQNRIVTPPVYVYTAHTAHTVYSRTAHTPYITIQHPSGCPLAGREELVLASSQPQGRAGPCLSGDAVVEGHVADVVESVLSL